MKQNRLFAMLASGLIALTAMTAVPRTNADAADKIKIMCVGDSITFGYGMGQDGGYRKFMDYALKQKGISFDLVGPEGSDSASFNYNGQNVSYDNNHAGYSGYQIKEVPGWGQQQGGKGSLYNELKNNNTVKKFSPDIILLIIGTNDMTANRDQGACANDLKDLVSYMLGDMAQGGTVFMGSIPEFTAYGGNAQRVAAYNSTVKSVADGFESEGKNVHFADVHGCLNGAADLQGDQLHPNAEGYEKMGKFWAETVENYLKSSVQTTTTTTEQTTTTTTVTYPAPWSDIWFSTMPDKTVYYVGEEFDITGARYSLSGEYWREGQSINYDAFDEALPTENPDVLLDASEFDSSQPGKYKIWLTDLFTGAKGSCEVEVVERPAETGVTSTPKILRISPDYLTLDVGQEEQVQAFFFPSGSMNGAEFEVSDDSIVSVTPDTIAGVYMVKGLRAGTAELKVIANYQTATVRIIVNAKAVNVRGDADENGTVTVGDCVLLARFLANDSGVSADFTEQGRKNADVDGIEGLSGDDLTKILRFLASLEPEL